MKIATLALCICSMVACSTSSAVRVDSVNQNSRVNIVVIHHTSSDFARSLTTLTEHSSRPVSSHYMIPEPLDPSYSEKKPKLYQFVDEERRAWHAGLSYWAGKTALNDMSIGIELVNRTYCHTGPETASPDPESEIPGRICFFPDYSTDQLEILTELLTGILERHPDVLPVNIVGHSDIAPQRKIDPGPRFPWQRLYILGFGAWYDDETVIRYWERFRLAMPPILRIQEALHAYGYQLDTNALTDQEYRNVVRAFQMHFAPQHVSGEMDVYSTSVLFSLIEKYRPEHLERLLAPLPAVAGQPACCASAREPSQ